MDKAEEPLESISYYMSQAFGDLSYIEDNARSMLETLEYDTMVGTGISGALVIPSLARALGKHWAIVRKDVYSHSSRKVEGRIGHKWLFVDDMISTGTTLQRVKGVISDITAKREKWDFSVNPSGILVPNPYPTEFVGSYLYEDNQLKGANYQN